MVCHIPHQFSPPRSVWDYRCNYHAASYFTTREQNTLETASLDKAGRGAGLMDCWLAWAPTRYLIDHLPLPLSSRGCYCGYESVWCVVCGVESRGVSLEAWLLTAPQSARLWALTWLQLITSAYFLLLYCVVFSLCPGHRGDHCSTAVLQHNTSSLTQNIYYEAIISHNKGGNWRVSRCYKTLLTPAPATPVL